MKLERIADCLLAVERAFESLAARKSLVVVLAGLASLLGRALLLPVLPVPKPAIQDEFSYLLASDTFASGRLTNPVHPFPEHFETLQVLSRPTYASKYPPLSGLMMALGQKIAGQPWAGVWLSSGLMCAAIGWALQGWLPSGWALVGAFVAVLRIGLVSYWTESYWGGSCAAMGGALVIGAVPRLVERVRPASAIAFAAGLAILANTRPNEGLILAVACTLYLAVALIRQRTAMALLVYKAGLPMALVLIPTLAWMAYYNYRVTGSALELPYIAHEKQYAVLSPLLWKVHASPAPVYSNSFLKEFWLVGDRREKEREHQHIFRTHVSDIRELWRFFLGWPLVLCILGCVRPLWRDPAVRSMSVIGAVFYAGGALDGRLYPHYAAPATALFYILAAAAIRALRQAWPGSLTEGVYVSWAAMAVFIVSSGLGLLTAENRYLFGPIDYHIRAKHATVEARLEEQPGKHLVFVTYGPRHELYEELVYNRADIDSSRVVWARSLGSELDQRLVQYYSDRQIWLLEDDGEIKVSGYPDARHAVALRSGSKD